MCGRFALSKSDRIDWAQFGVRRGPALPPHWNLGPGRPIAVVRHAADGAKGAEGAEGAGVALLRWGLIPSWAKDVSIGNRLANARAETAPDKPSFRAAFKQRRCLIPADGFYEWQVVAGASRKQPWFVQRRDGGVFALAGLWERWQQKGQEPLETCTVLTTEPNALMAPIHSRMPVIIDPSAYAAWLAAETPAEAARTLMAPWDPRAWTAYRVSTRVNAASLDDAACVAPLGDDATR
jgi:putative SOS response-associated peptidase YedK